MKKLFILMLILSCSIFAKAQGSRWKLLLTNDTTKDQTFVDTTRTQKLTHIDGHLASIVILWLKTTSSQNQGQEIEEKVAVDIDAVQLEVKSIMKKSDGKEIDQSQLMTDWRDIYPETTQEKILFYCKNYLKSLGN